MKLHECAEVCKTMEDVIEAGEGIKTSVNARVKEGRFKDRSGKGRKEKKPAQRKGASGGNGRSAEKSIG